MTSIQRALLISAAVHLLLLGLGFIIYYEITPEQLFRQIEILEFRMDQAPTSRVTDYRPVRRVGDPSIREFSEGQSSSHTPSKVELPKVTHEFDDPLQRIDIPTQPEVATTPFKLDERVGNTSDRVQGSISQDAIDLSAARIKEQPMALAGDDFLDRLNTLIGESSDSPSAYFLEGEIQQRTILKEVIPEYPEGLQRNATVEIQFNVYPDGRVGEMIIVKKDEAILEELSLESLSQWRFNPIPQDVVQKGKITFIYQLK